MRHRSRLIILGIVLLATAVFAQNLRDIEISTEGYTPSKVCGKCHKEIHRYWSKSMHALSLEDPIFQTSYKLAVFEEGEKAKVFCLRCHAPTVAETKDYDLTDPATEGISCDFCHSVTGIKSTKTGFEFTTDPGGPKRSTLKKAESPVHKVAYSKLHHQSEFCSGCHELYGPSGVIIMGTYSEWKAGPYAKEGVQCVDCHMPEVAGNVVVEGVRPRGRPGIRRDETTRYHNPEQLKKMGKNECVKCHKLDASQNIIVEGAGPEGGARINRHDISGYHTAEQVRKAVTVKLESVKRVQNRVRVEVSISNVGSGHYVPTGMPSRKLRLVVTMTDMNGDLVGVKEKIYGRKLYDAEGNELVEDHMIMLKAFKSGEDNRIKPREKRMEQFWFYLKPSTRVKVKVDLFYVYNPQLILRKEMRIEVQSISNTFKP